MTDLEAASLLAHATSVADLVPVDAAAAAAVSRRLRRMAATLGLATRELRSLESAPAWKGDAGRSFERRVSGLPNDAAHATEVFDDAGRAFADLAEAIITARPDANTAFHLWHLALAQSRRWSLDTDERARSGNAPAGLAPTDPGAATADRAISLYSRARSQMEEATSRAMLTLLRAGDAAPGHRQLMDREGAIESLRGVGTGLGDFATGWGKFTRDFNQVRAVLDPDGFSRDAEDMGTGLAALARHPDELDDVLLDLDLLREDPARWVGKVLIPTIAFAPVARGTPPKPTTTGLIAARIERLGGLARIGAAGLDDVSRIVKGLDLPPLASVVNLAHPGSNLRQALDSARRVDPKKEQIERLADERSGRPEQYESRIATVSLDDGSDLTFEFVHDTATDEMLEPRVVAGDGGKTCDE